MKNNYILASLQGLFTSCCLLMTLLLPQFALSGGMVSSGGELIQNAHNPWWVKNTTDVKYCIAIDPSSLSADPAKIPILIEKAFLYWKAELSQKLTLAKNSDYLNQYFNRIGIGHQNFTKGNCDGTESLKFQFGYGTLSLAQKKILTNLNTLVGITVRTDYDEVLLKGKGFIYISSDLGPYKYTGTDKMVAKPWSMDALLFFAIVHELGHVFGLPHVGPAYTLMSEQFMDALLSKEIAATVIDFDPKTTEVAPFFFMTPSVFGNCEKHFLSAETTTFFGIPVPAKCLVFGVEPTSKKIYVSFMKDEKALPSVIGVLQDLDLNAEATLAVTVVATPLQKVFDPITSPLSVIAGPSFFLKKGSAKYVNYKGETKPVHLTLAPGHFDIVGNVGSSLKSVIDADVRFSQTFLK